MGSGATPTHSYAETANYPVSLTVTDNDGLSDSNDTTATIGVGNLPPVADANGPYGGDVGADISFDGNASEDPEGTIVSWEWRFGDGTTGTGPTPTHSYTDAGKYFVLLTVTDDQGQPDSTVTTADIGPVDLTGTVEDAGGTPLCALALASGQFMFTCNPNGPYDLQDLPRENDGTVKRQVYVDGFFPNVETLPGSDDETVVMTRASNCPDYNAFPDPGVNPGSDGKRIDVSGTVLLQDTQTPVCAMVLGNGQFGFTCDGTGSYAANIPLDANGQYKLQVYAQGFAPMVQRFDELSPDVEVRLARAAECQ
jgi:PKD repeat protein